MKSDWKRALEEAFAAPEPKRKKEFLRKIEPPRISTFSFMLSQICYIRKRVWLISVLISILAVMSADYVGQNCLWIISAMMPFIALGAITENARSVTCNMAELEMASRFSLKSITLARLGAIGLSHVVIFCVLIPVVGKYASLPLGKVGIYLFVPYLLTTVSGLVIARRVHAREMNYICVGVAVVVSCLNFIIRGIMPWLYKEKQFVWWVVCVICLLVSAWKEYKKVINQTEELAWNW